ncbi:hypothetical protein [Klebsiella quasipneumoniae]|uniref:hypothetical protein n=1 Tax=Klebsiella quasipneumoniae TaxID=1463165 RepID=UPI0022041EEF|nr:hypothetical protein [Klebsiella quasipneumoniae]BDO06013.1 hypothetical protein KAM622c_56000 [Klebsiella quasipneumoniae subsp. quasipneumoniae]
MSKLTGEVIHGILLSLPEFIDMPEVLAFNTRCEILIFHTRCGASELWKFEIFPRTTKFDAAYFGNTLKLGGAECIKNFFFSNGNPVRAAYGPVGWPCG